MIAFVETRLRERGVKVWFGNATNDLEVTRLRAFYAHHGFTVLAEGQPLPPLLGREWVAPSAGPSAFYFYKTIPVIAAS